MVWLGLPTLIVVRAPLEIFGVARRTAGAGDLDIADRVHPGVLVVGDELDGNLPEDPCRLVVPEVVGDRLLDCMDASERKTIATR